MTRMFTSREFNQDAARAKRAAEEGPVVITDRGRPSHVLMSYEAYERLLGAQMSLFDAVASEDDFDFEPPRLRDEVARAADLD